MSLQLVKSDQSLVSGSVVKAAEALGLTREQLANTIGVSVPTVARMKAGGELSASKPLEIALLVIRVYRALYAIVGGDGPAMTHWMKTPNRHLSEQSGQPAIPIKMMQSAEGLARVLWYLDSMRGRF